MREVDAAWQEWLATNVSRGCTQESMVESMVQAGFEMVAAQEIVRRAASATVAQVAAVASPADEARAYDYDVCHVAEGNTIHAHDRDVAVRVRFDRPQVIAFDDVLSAEECAELIERARHRLKRSTTVNPDNGREDVIQVARFRVAQLVAEIAAGFELIDPVVLRKHGGPDAVPL